MITSQLLHPASIVVVGASNNVHKPGGAILKNLLNGGYTGELRAVNPKETEVQGVAAFADVKDIPDTDLAILAIPAALCPDAVEMLAAEKQVKAFIILSAGFGEETHEGAVLEDRILETVNRYGASDRPQLYRFYELVASQCIQPAHPATASARGGPDFQLRCHSGVHIGERRDQGIAIQLCMVCGQCQANRRGGCVAIHGRTLQSGSGFQNKTSLYREYR